MNRPDWTPDDVDLNQPSPARIYDYNLGGSHNFAIDRIVAEQINQAMPELPAVNRANRSFLRRVVRFLVGAGIRQFLDLGSGIPTVGNVHEIAQQAAPESRVVYVDVDPVAVLHSDAILAENDRAAAIHADLREPEQILADPTVRRLIDFTRPVAVMALAVLHFIPDRDDPVRIVRTLRDAIVPGSYLALSHAAGSPETRRRAEDATRLTGRLEVTFRERTEIARFFEGFDLVEPGLVFTPRWRPDTPHDTFSDQPERSATLAGVGVKR